jgi:hypothetical protein
MLFTGERMTGEWAAAEHGSIRVQEVWEHGEWEWQVVFVGGRDGRGPVSTAVLSHGLE